MLHCVAFSSVLLRCKVLCRYSALCCGVRLRGVVVVVPLTPTCSRRQGSRGCVPAARSSRRPSAHSPPSPPPPSPTHFPPSLARHPLSPPSPASRPPSPPSPARRRSLHSLVTQEALAWRSSGGRHRNTRRRSCRASTPPPSTTCSSHFTSPPPSTSRIS